MIVPIELHDRLMWLQCGSLIRKGASRNEASAPLFWHFKTTSSASGRISHDLIYSIQSTLFIHTRKAASLAKRSAIVRALRGCSWLPEAVPKIAEPNQKVVASRAYTPCRTPAWRGIPSYYVNYTFTGVSNRSMSPLKVRCRLTWQPLHRSFDLGISLRCPQCLGLEHCDQLMGSE